MSVFSKRITWAIHRKKLIEIIFEEAQPLDLADKFFLDFFKIFFKFKLFILIGG